MLGTHRILSPLVLLVLLQSMLQTFAQESLLCSLDGACFQSNPSFAPGQSQVFNKAVSCPASDCDGTGTLQHHIGDTDTGTSLACSAGAFTQANGYLRCFSGGALCTTDRIVDSVTFGVGFLDIASVDVTVNIFKGVSSDCDTTASVGSLYASQPVVTRSVTVAETALFRIETVDLPLPLEFLPTESLLVEIRAPDLTNTGNFFIADSNDPDQCDPSYNQNEQCGQMMPTPTSDILDQNNESKGDVSFLIKVNTSPVPTPSPTAAPPPPGCFDSFQLALGCLFDIIFDWLFSWLLPF